MLTISEHRARIGIFDTKKILAKKITSKMYKTRQIKAGYQGKICRPVLILSTVLLLIILKCSILDRSDKVYSHQINIKMNVLGYNKYVTKRLIGGEGDPLLLGYTWGEES